MQCFHWLHRISCVVTKDNIAFPLYLIQHQEDRQAWVPLPASQYLIS